MGLIAPPEQGQVRSSELNHAAATTAVSGPTASGGVTAVVGLQWGDEGKGKFVDRLAPGYSAVVRYNGGANAGHSVVVGGTRFSMHLTPSGILHPGVLAVIGSGVVLHPPTLMGELAKLTAAGVDVSGLRVSTRAHVVMPYHLEQDALRESILTGASDDDAIGTTKRGIGPCYADRAHRAGAIRAGDLVREDVLREKLRLACLFKNKTLAPNLDERSSFTPDELLPDCLAWGEALRPYLCDTTYLLHDMLRAGEKVLAEGANGALLDVDHGGYPFVTSSNSTVLGFGPGTGVPERRVERVLGICKAYATRVGGGPMPTELNDATAERIRERGREFGTTTGRPRRCGWLDLVAVRYAAMINGASEIVLTLLDVLAGFDELKVCTAYRVEGETTDRFPPDAFILENAEPVYETLPGFADEITEARSWDALPHEAQSYVRFIEEYVGVPVRIVSVGPDRTQTIER